MNDDQRQFKLPGGEVLSLKAVTPTDEPFLLSIYASTREDELSQVVWANGQKEAFLTWQFELQRQQYEARFPDAEYKIILIDNEPTGRIWIGRNQKEIRLLDIALLPQFQNRGVGTVLLKELIAESDSSGKSLRHMVFVLNNNANRFYERLGFVEIEDLGGYKHMEYRPNN